MATKDFSLLSITPQRKPSGDNRASDLYFGAGLSQLVSGFATLASASAEARQFKIQTAFQDLQASNQKLKAQENAIFLRKKFFKDLSSANASFAGGMVARESGIGRRFAVESLRNLQEDLETNELNSEGIQNSLSLAKSQTQLRQETAKNLGLIRSGRSFFKAGQSLLTGFEAKK